MFKNDFDFSHCSSKVKKQTEKKDVYWERYNEVRIDVRGWRRKWERERENEMRTGD